MNALNLQNEYPRHKTKFDAIDNFQQEGAFLISRDGPDQGMDFLKRVVDRRTKVPIVVDYEPLALFGKKKFLYGRKAKQNVKDLLFKKYYEDDSESDEENKGLFSVENLTILSESDSSGGEDSEKLDLNASTFKVGKPDMKSRFVFGKLGLPYRDRWLFSSPDSKGLSGSVHGRNGRKRKFSKLKKRLSIDVSQKAITENQPTPQPAEEAPKEVEKARERISAAKLDQDVWVMNQKAGTHERLRKLGWSVDDDTIDQFASLGTEAQDEILKLIDESKLMVDPAKEKIESWQIGPRAGVPLDLDAPPADLKEENAEHLGTGVRRYNLPVNEILFPQLPAFSKYRKRNRETKTKTKSPYTHQAC